MLRENEGLGVLLKGGTDADVIQPGSHRAPVLSRRVYLEQQRHLRTCETCDFLGPAPNWLNRKPPGLSRGLWWAAAQAGSSGWWRMWAQELRGGLAVAGQRSGIRGGGVASPACATVPSSWGWRGYLPRTTGVRASDVHTGTAPRNTVV